MHDDTTHTAPAFYWGSRAQVIEALTTEGTHVLTDAGDLFQIASPEALARRLDACDIPHARPGVLLTADQWEVPS